MILPCNVKWEAELHRMFTLGANRLRRSVCLHCDWHELKCQLAGAALDSLALNVALSTGVAADKAGKCFQV